MYVIKMNDDKSLTATIKATIYQYEKNADTLLFLIPMTYEDTNFADCTVLLRYILPNGIGKSEELEILPEPYKNYYQYHLKVSTRFTDKVGKIELWLSAINSHDDLVLKTGTTYIEVQETKDISKYLSDEDRNQLDKLSEKVAQLETRKADNIIFDDNEKYLQLTSNGTPIGNKIDMGMDGSIIYFDSDRKENDQGVDDTSSDTANGNNDVIYF